ncbi:NAD(P)H-binding protein [Kineosporia sp. J2-2]|uniref:NAD(P)H-binding protein n=1 Tax=Kineosporia corallincola TaxID=2835133 RepID=A0ABS5TKJ2_9ACTN|nr:NAD(P)H-binding protein [Kineosporia corallincola]MBT0771616.1 NAD(P)H-binding protein [Kineosporia corallincola]
MIAVTAPTSRIGRHLVRDLLAAGEKVRVVARDPARLGPAVAGRVEVVAGTHADAAVVTEAFHDADAVFWLVPAAPHASSPDEAYSGFARPALRAFTSFAGRVVGVSALGRGTPAAGRAGHVTATLAMDDAIVATGVAYRALTLPSFMDNVARQAGPIAARGVWSGPAAPGLAVPTVAARDIAAAAAGWLTDSTWSGHQEVPVLGPEDLSPDRMAEIASEVLGRPVRYQQIEPEAFLANLVRAGHSEAMARGLLDMALAKNDGLDLGVTRTPASSSPTTFRQWCEETLEPAVAG